MMGLCFESVEIVFYFYFLKIQANFFEGKGKNKGKKKRNKAHTKINMKNNFFLFFIFGYVKKRKKVAFVLAKNIFLHYQVFNSVENNGQPKIFSN